MYITQEADYAIRIVYCLAKAGTRRDARSISEEVAVTLRFSLKILGKLSAAGIVKSFKGNRGGYELARAPGETSLKDVLCVVDGPYAMSRCLQKGQCNCKNTCDCVFHEAFGRISRTVNEELDKVTFDILLEEEQNRNMPAQ